MPLTPLALGRRLHFQHLQLLVEVAQGGTLSAASERLHVSRAAVSKALREVESALGLTLFERSATGMRATNAGQRVVEHARLLLTEFRHFADEVGNVRRRAPPMLRLGMSPFIAERWAPQIVARLAALQPRGGAPRSTLREGRLVQLLEQLTAGEIDAALSLHSAGGAYGIDTSALHIEPIRAEPLIVVAAPNQTLPRKRKLSWADLHGMPWILPPVTTHLRRLFDECYAALGMSAPLPLIESPMLAANVRFARAGLGITLVPASAVDLDVKQRALRAIDTLAALPQTDIVLMHRRATPPDPGWLDPLRQAVFETLRAS
jgi:DNA-binding transcriptional LysR family regulator